MSETPEKRRVNLTIAASELRPNLVRDRTLGDKRFILLEVLAQDVDSVTVGVVAGGGMVIPEASLLLTAVAGTMEMPEFREYWAAHQAGGPGAN